MAIYIVMLGPPGVGKGTQAKIIAKMKAIAHISTGDLFRENIKNQTELGRTANDYIIRGELVPDDVTIGMVRERLMEPDCTDGALLDGFPRTPAQADGLESILIEKGSTVTRVPFISADEAVLVERLSGRWTCRAEGHVFHEKHNPPLKQGVCDFDGSELYQREDDREDTVKTRMQVYFDQTAPLIAYYKDRGILVKIDGSQSIENVSAEILAAIED